MLCNLAYVKTESRSTALSRLIDAVIKKHAKSTIFFSHLRQVIIIHLSFRPLKIGTFSSFTVKRPLCCLHSMSKDGRKMSLMHVLNTESGYNEESGLRHSLDAPWSLGRKAVFCAFVRVLGRVRNAWSPFYIRVCLIPSPYFIPSP